MTCRAALLSIALAFGAAPVTAQTPPDAAIDPGLLQMPREAAAVEPWAGRLFEALDTNADGQITGAELTPLARGEIAARGGSRIRAVISRSDASNDARVTREELLAGADRMFRRMDADGDGRLSDTESPPPAPRTRVAIPMPAPVEPMPMPGLDETED